MEPLAAWEPCLSGNGTGYPLPALPRPLHQCLTPGCPHTSQHSTAPSPGHCAKPQKPRVGPSPCMGLTAAVDFGVWDCTALQGCSAELYAHGFPWQISSKAEGWTEHLASYILPAHVPMSAAQGRLGTAVALLPQLLW